MKMTKTIHDVYEVVGLINGSKKIQSTWKGQLVHEYLRDVNGQWDYIRFEHEAYSEQEAIDTILFSIESEPDCDWVFFPAR
jgi:hypothetical protein